MAFFPPLKAELLGCSDQLAPVVGAFLSVVLYSCFVFHARRAFICFVYSAPTGALVFVVFAPVGGLYILYLCPPEGGRFPKYI